MNKQIVAVVVIIVSMLGILFAVYASTNSPKSETPVNVKLNKKALIYFHGVTCPNCQELNKWIKDNQIDRKVNFQKREVYYNEENAALLEQAADVCGIPNNQIGVPFIYDNGECYIGVPDAQRILKQKADKKR